MLSAAERRQLLREWNDTAAGIPAATCRSLFAAQVAAHPEAVAVVSGDMSLSYAELDARASRLARYLIGAGAGPEQVVAIALPRGGPMIMALLAVLKAGAAYMPVDPGYPARRITFMLGEAAPLLLITDGATATNLPGARVPTLVLDRDGTARALAGCPAAPVTDADRRTPLRPDNPAYVMYTSGSTGIPKGIVVTQRSVVNLGAWMRRRFGRLSRVLAVTSVSFDVSIFEILGTLCGCGGCVEIAADLLALLDAPVGGRPGILVCAVPSSFLEVAARGTVVVSDSTIVLAGEALSEQAAEAIRAAAPGCALVNAYGPAEVGYATAYFLGETSADRGVPPIGRPIANTRVYVLDCGLQAGAGWRGRRAVHRGRRAGARLSAGGPALTAERFVACPFGGHRGSADVPDRRPGALAAGRRTGVPRPHRRPGEDPRLPHRAGRDRGGAGRASGGGAGGGGRAGGPARRPAAGRRMWSRSPGEVPTRRSCGARRGAAAGVHGAGGVRGAGGAAADAEREAGPDGAAGAGRTRPAIGEYAAPRTPREEVLARVWARGAGRWRGSASHDNFFDLGGHSLLAVRLIARVRAVLGVEVSIRALFEAPTVAGLARLLDAAAARYGRR